MTDNHAIDNAKAWFSTIVEMVDALRKVDSLGGSPAEDENRQVNALDAARERILESALSVEVRSGWYSPGDPDNTQEKPAEFSILLSTGGPALRLIGELNEHGEPETARLEHQNWGTPWMEVALRNLAQELDASLIADRPNDLDRRMAAHAYAQAYLLDFARQFYFGEG